MPGHLAILANCGQDLTTYLVNGASPVDLRNQVLAPVVVEHRDGLAQIDLDPRLHSLLLVVFALDDLRAVSLAFLRARRVRALARRAHQPARQAPEQLRRLDTQIERG